MCADTDRVIQPVQSLFAHSRPSAQLARPLRARSEQSHGACRSALSKERTLALDGPHAPEMVKMDISVIARSGMITLKASCRSDIKPNSPQIRDEKPCDTDQKYKKLSE